MSDGELRDLERRWQATGAEEDAERYLAARMRAGGADPMFLLGELVRARRALRALLGMDGGLDRDDETVPQRERARRGLDAPVKPSDILALLDGPRKPKERPNANGRIYPAEAMRRALNEWPGDGGHAHGPEEPREPELVCESCGHVESEHGPHTGVCQATWGTDGCPCQGFVAPAVCESCGHAESLHRHGHALGPFCSVLGPGGLPCPCRRPVAEEPEIELPCAACGHAMAAHSPSPVSRDPSETICLTNLGDRERRACPCRSYVPIPAQPRAFCPCGCGETDICPRGAQVIDDVAAGRR